MVKKVLTLTNRGAIPFGVRSLYNYLGGAKAGDLTKLDLPRAVRYKPRSRPKAPGASAIPRGDLEGRRWADFCALDQADRDNAVEMDTVVGRSGKDEQCILTLFLSVSATVKPTILASVL